jgi:CheY-like chemotaxis protein
LLDIINDILDFSKIEANKIVIEQVDFDLHQTVDDCLQVLRGRAHEKDLSIACVMGPLIPLRVMGDPTRLRQVLFNLIGNAIKFTKHGGITIDIQQVACAGQEIHLRFNVQDTGIGIPAEQLGKIFEAFAQADISTTRQYGGTGLGLTITQRLVNLMGGQLSVNSQPGSGSSFAFNLPFLISPVQVSENASSPLVHQPLPSLSVLVVEDQPINQLLACKLLEKWGHRVHLAENGQVALDCLLRHEERFDLILMDMQMPVMGGIEATAKIRNIAAFQHLPIVATTANAMLGDRELCLEAGMTDYVSKPILAQELEDKLRRLFAR